jgi:hypothetical protein
MVRAAAAEHIPLLLQMSFYNTDYVSNLLLGKDSPLKTEVLLQRMITVSKPSLFSISGLNSDEDKNPAF